MGRRSDHSQEELKELIIGASIKLVSKDGPGAFGTRAIAREIGYSFGTIYHIYGDIESLRYHVKGRILDELHDSLFEGMQNEENKVRFLVDSYIDFSVYNSNLWAFMFALPNEPRENVPAWYMEKVETLFSLVVDTFATILPDRETAETAARAMWPSIHGVCALTMSHKLEMVSDESPKEISHKLLEAYLCGLQAGTQKSG